MSKERKDFVQVRLTEPGRAFAGEGHQLVMVTNRMHYVFTGHELVEVLRAGEWAMLRNDEDSEGNPLFEVVPSVAATAAGESVEA